MTEANTRPMWAPDVADVRTIGKNDDGAPYTRVTSIPGTLDGRRMLLVVTEVVREARDVVHVVAASSTVRELFERASFELVRGSGEIGDAPTALPEDPPAGDDQSDGFDDVRLWLGDARDPELTRMRRLAAVMVVRDFLGRAEVPSMPEDMAQVSMLVLDNALATLEAGRELQAGEPFEVTSRSDDGLTLVRRDVTGLGFQTSEDGGSSWGTAWVEVVGDPAPTKLLTDADAKADQDGTDRPDNQDAPVAAEDGSA